eukprot:g42212.t1
MDTTYDPLGECKNRHLPRQHREPALSHGHYVHDPLGECKNRHLPRQHSAVKNAKFKWFPQSIRGAPCDLDAEEIDRREKETVDTDAKAPLPKLFRAPQSEQLRTRTPPPQQYSRSQSSPGSSSGSSSSSTSLSSEVDPDGSQHKRKVYSPQISPHHVSNSAKRQESQSRMSNSSKGSGGKQSGSAHSAPKVGGRRGPFPRPAKNLKARPKDMFWSWRLPEGPLRIGLCLCQRGTAEGKLGEGLEIRSN